MVRAMMSERDYRTMKVSGRITAIPYYDGRYRARPFSIDSVQKSELRVLPYARLLSGANLLLFYRTYNDHWYVPISDLLIPLVTRIHRCQARPEALLLHCRSLLRLNSSSNSLNLYPDFRRGLQIEPPSGMLHRAAIGRHQHYVSSVYQI